MKWKTGDPVGLVYDIETLPMPALVWGLGEQVVRHGQMLSLEPKIICIAYAYIHKPGVHILTWDEETQSNTEMIRQFDEIIKKADYIIGKNNANFDNKRINTARLLNGLPPMPDWLDKSDDLEKQMRKHFYMPSQSLDFVADILGYGKKDKMEFDDWKNIFLAYPLAKVTSLKDADQVSKGKQAFDKMCRYCKRDVKLTKDIILKVMPYVTFRFNRSVWEGRPCCKLPTCGSTHVVKNGLRLVNGIKKQRWQCGTCGAHAGYSSVNSLPGTPLR